MIDLGVLGSDAVPTRPASRRRRTLAWPPRWLTVPVTLVVAWLGLAGATASDSTGLAELSSVPASTGSQYTILGDNLYVAEPVDGGFSHVTAYRLRDGRARWSVPVNLPTLPIGLTEADGVVLASVNLAGASGNQTVALDAQTGSLLWNSPAVFQGLLAAAHRALLTSAFPMDFALVPGAAPTDKLGTEVVAVDLRDGREAWRYELTAGCVHATDAAAAGAPMAVLCPVGSAQQGPSSETDELRAIDLATGEVDRAVRLTLPVAVPPNPLGTLRLAGAPVRPVLSVVAGRILVGAAGDSSGGTATMNAYDPATLRPLWTRQMSSIDYEATPCAGLLCLTDAYGLAVVDPPTGAVRWHTSERAFAVPAGALASRLLVQPSGGARVALVDVGTGRPVLDLDGWRVVAGGPGALPIFARWQPQPDGRAWLATVTMDPPALRPAGFAPDLLEDKCVTGGDYLVCQTLTQRLRVWRYRA